MSTPKPITLSEHLSRIGKIATGDKKRRGDKAYYQALRAKVGKNKSTEVSRVDKVA